MEMADRNVPRAMIATTLQRTVAAIENRLNIVRNRQMLSVQREIEVWGDNMHPAAEFQFARVASEYAKWRAVPEAQRSGAPAWWWQPAFEVRDRQELMSPIWCHHLELPIGSSFAAGAAVLMAALADQTSLPWSDEFPRKLERDHKSDETDH
jgi:hypothetical protein